MKSPTPSPISDQAAGELRVLPKDVLDALRFYAHGHHYSIDDDHQEFDAVSGEPVNWMFSEKDDDCTMFEDGGIARAVLAGRSAGFEEPVEPFEGEVFTARSTAPTTGSGPVAFYDPNDTRRQESFVWASDYPNGTKSSSVPLYAATASPAASVLPEGWSVRVTPFEVQVRGPDGKGYSGSRSPKSKDGLAGYTLVKLVLALLDREALLAASMGGDKT